MKSYYNVLSIDVEFWLSRVTESAVTKENKNELINLIFRETIVEPIMNLLEILERDSITTTFFVTSSVYAFAPDLVEKISRNRHEIAFHGYVHNRSMPLMRQVKKSADFLRRYNVRGYRAPEMSTNQLDLNVLSKYGFVYDSSTYGGCPYQKCIDSHSLIWEIPVSCYPSTITAGSFKEAMLSGNIPVGSGISFRVMPKWITHAIINRLNSNSTPAVMFIHQWQLVNLKRLITLTQMLLRNSSNDLRRKLRIRDLYSFSVFDYKLIRNILENHHFITMSELVEKCVKY